MSELANRLADVKMFTVVFLLVAVLMFSLVYPYFVRAPAGQSFQIYLLGAVRTNDLYYHSGDSSVLFGKKAKWHFGVVNLSGSIQYVVVRARLGNSSYGLPDHLRGTPSPAPLIAEFSRTLMANETWEFFFIWVVKEIQMTGEAVTPTMIEIDGVQARSVRVSASRGKNFRIVFELWTMEPMTGNLVFGWKPQKEGNLPWLHMWFNLTLPS